MHCLITIEMQILSLIVLCIWRGIFILHLYCKQILKLNSVVFESWLYHVFPVKYLMILGGYLDINNLRYWHRYWQHTRQQWLLLPFELLLLIFNRIHIANLSTEQIRQDIFSSGAMNLISYDSFSCTVEFTMRYCEYQVAV